MPFDFHSSMYFSGLPAPVVTNCHALLGDDLRHLIRVGAHQHHVDSEGLIGALLGLPDLFPHPFRRGVGRADDTKAPRLGHGCRQMILRHPGHAALDNRVSDSQ